VPGAAFQKPCPSGGMPVLTVSCRGIRAVLHRPDDRDGRKDRDQEGFLQAFCVRWLSFCRQAVKNMRFARAPCAVSGHAKTMVKISSGPPPRQERPFYHVVATESRSSARGRFIERLGYYNPSQGRREEAGAGFPPAWITGSSRCAVSERVAHLIKIEPARCGGFCGGAGRLRFSAVSRAAAPRRSSQSDDMEPPAAACGAGADRRRFRDSGWVRVQSYTRPAENLLDYGQWWLAGNRPLRCRCSSRDRTAGFRAHLADAAGVENQRSGCRRRADRHRKSRVDRDDLPPPEPGTWYWAIWSGCGCSRCPDTRSARWWRWWINGAQDVLVLDDEGTQRLIPFCAPHHPRGEPGARTDCPRTGNRLLIAEFRCGARLVADTHGDGRSAGCGLTS